MEGIHVSLPNKESLDNQHLRQKEQPSDCSVYIDNGKVQVLNKPTVIEDHGHLIYDYRNQQSASEKNITCTSVGDSLSREELMFTAILYGLTILTDKEKGAQLEKLFLKFRKNEISRGDFIQLVKDIVGSQLFAFVVKKVHMKVSSPESSVAFETKATLPGKRRDQEEKLSKKSPTAVPLPSLKEATRTEVVL